MAKEGGVKLQRQGAGFQPAETQRKESWKIYGAQGLFATQQRTKVGFRSPAMKGFEAGMQHIGDIVHWSRDAVGTGYLQLLDGEFLIVPGA
jgi:hypothetical protein